MVLVESFSTPSVVDNTKLRMESYLERGGIRNFELAVKTLDLSVLDAQKKRLEILDTFNAHFTLYEELFKTINDRGHFVPADPLRHPLIFYLGHTAAFYINKLVLAKLLTFNERVDPTIESLVAIGVDEMSWDDLLSEDYPWPSVAVMKEFRCKVRHVVSELILKRLPLDNNTVINWEHPFWPIIMGIEHERIHLETSSVLIRQLPMEYILPQPTDSIWSNVCMIWRERIGDVPLNSWINVSGGEVRLGRPIHNKFHDELKSNISTVYGWDNEYGLHVGTVSPFRASKQLVSNAEFLEFMEAGGYKQKKYWSEEGWSWVQFKQPNHPLFWVATDSGYVLRNMISVTCSMPWDWPVELNCLESAAYCRWYSEKTGIFTRLPTEDEYNMLLCSRSPFCDSNDDSGDKDQYLPTNCNIGLLKYSSSTPVDMYSTDGVNDVMGNIWQWTKTPTYPFNGFVVHPLYDDFTSPTFDDKHNMIKGGSWITTGNEATRFSRYAFRRHFFQYAGLRMIQPLNEAQPVFEPDFEPKNVPDFSGIEISEDVSYGNGNPYDTDVAVQQVCEFQYGPKIPFVPIDNFSVVVARVTEAVIKQSKFWGVESNLRVLDLGCGVGRTSFELARTFSEVVGMDMTARVVQVGYEMAQRHRIRYRIPIEGEIPLYREAVLGSPEIPLDGSDGNSLVRSIFGVVPDSRKLELGEIVSRTWFVQGDVCNLPEKPRLYNFHCIVANNILDRAYNPKAFLKEIKARIMDGGFLILLSSNSWNKELTQFENWIGGKKVDGENVFTLDALQEILADSFDLIRVKPVDAAYSDCLPSLNMGVFDDVSKGMKSFHIPSIIRENYRKYSYIFSECSIWQKRA
jgi:5-histidylcysteine sulfoxide synthase